MSNLSNFTFLLLLSLFHVAFSSLPHKICSASPSVTFRGQNDISRGGGAKVIMFCQLQCANCYGVLRRLNDMAAHRTHRIFIVAPDFESNHIIQRTASAFPNLQIDRAGEGWPRLGANAFDVMILDSCNRVTDTLSWPQTDVTTSHALQMAMDATSSKCGACYQNQNQNNQNFQNPAKKVNAYIKERENSEAMYQNQNQNYQQPRHQNSYQNHNQNVNPRHQQNYQNHRNSEVPRHQNHQNYQNSHQNPIQNQNFYTPPPSTTTSPPKTTTTSDPTDYDYYPNEETGAQEVKTTMSTQTQIPRPPIYPNWQNTPYQQYQPIPPQYQNPMMMDANLPCSAFSDDICYQQKQSMGVQMSKCCNKGVYLTDVCIPGKCSNSTVQLCCFQKFLQAKYSCCADPLQDEGGKRLTNMFNKCCHNLFVTDDPCCPEIAAKRYWSSAYEVCMPTVTVDFSPVRFEVKTVLTGVHFTEGVRVLDLSTDRQWDFNCTYGKKQHQFAYLP